VSIARRRWLIVMAAAISTATATMVSIARTALANRDGCGNFDGHGGHGVGCDNGGGRGDDCGQGASHASHGNNHRLAKGMAAIACTALVAAVMAVVAASATGVI